MRLVLALSLQCVVGAAFADEPTAPELYRQGADAFAAGRFFDATKLFEQSYALSREPKLLWNIALAHRRLYDVDHDVRHLRAAALVYRNYRELTVSDDEKSEAASAEADVRAQLAAIERQKASPPAALVEEPAPKRSHKRLWVWGVVVGATALAGGAIALGVTLGASHDPKFHNGAPTMTVTF